MDNILFLSSFVFIPLVMLFGLWVARSINQVRGVMVAGSTALLALSVYLTIRFLGDRAAGIADEMLYTGAISWFEPLNIKYSVGVDGISVAMLLLSSVIVFTGTFASWQLKPLTKEYFLWFTLLSMGVFGFFITVDMFAMFMFYEIALIPMYLLIGVWGSGRKEYSAMKLTLMLMGGSAFLMCGIFGIFYGSGAATMNIVEIANQTGGAHAIDFTQQCIWFPLTFIGFGVLGALFPFHTWSPDGHASAPTAVSMLHAGVLMKLGGYGCFRIAMYLMPEAANELGWIFLILTGISVVYGAFSACVQTDLKYINAYSSVSHCGLVLFAILMLNQTACTGAVLQILSHGLMTALFFALIVVAAVFVSGLYSFTYMSHDDSLVNYYTLFLMLSGSVLGLVLSGDLFNIFVMVEIMTFTAVALTAFRNHCEGALEGAFKYLVVGSLGSTCLLVGIGLIYSQLHTLNLAQIAALLPGCLNPVTIAAFGFLFVGFGTKAFLFPFHPLAADAHAVAPASISLMISGVLTKCGVYGIIRLVYILYRNMDQPFVQYFVTAVGAVSMFVCVTMAFNQHNFKRLLAFHSISQVGYVITVVGLGSMLGLSAGLYHAMNHTIFKGLLFLTAGAVQHATGSLDLDSLGGLSKKMPRTTVLFLIGAASISGLPPFNGFASKWMIYQAAFEKGAATGNFFFIIVCVAALITSVLTLASFIKVAQSVFFGQLPDSCRDVKEVSPAVSPCGSWPPCASSPACSPPRCRTGCCCPPPGPPWTPPATSTPPWARAMPPGTAWPPSRRPPRPSPAAGARCCGCSCWCASPWRCASCPCWAAPAGAPPPLSPRLPPTGTPSTSPSSPARRAPIPRWGAATCSGASSTTGANTSAS